MVRILLSVAIVLLATLAPSALAQNPVQWSGSVPQSVSRATELSLPLLFWVSEGNDFRDGNDLRDAQEESFRDRKVVAIIHKWFVPVRVSRNSRVLAEAQKLGLPTTFGLFAAVLTPDGKLLGEIGPGDIADPRTFATRLMNIFEQYAQEFYQRELLPRLENPEAPKSEARLAAQTVWRMGLVCADKGMIALAQRKDLTPTERSRVYTVLASLATKSCIEFLLAQSDAGDQEAAQALTRGGPGALEWLVPEMPGPSGEVTPRQMTAYQSVARLCRFPSPRDQAWWNKATPQERETELDRLKTKAAAVLEYWIESEGPWR